MNLSVEYPFVKISLQGRESLDGKNRTTRRSTMTFRRLAILLSIGLFLGCKGPKGDSGPQGPSGAGKVNEIMGIIPSNSFTVTNASITATGNAVLVYVGSVTSNEWIQLPFYDANRDVLASCVLHNGSVDIGNGLAIGGISYRIVIVRSGAPQAYQSSWPFSSRLLE
jgi:hypothetical protein